MASLETNADFLALVRKSGLIEEKALEARLARLSQKAPLPEDSTELARVLVREGLLTNFQAGQLLQGKWRRFFLGKYKILSPLGAGGMGNVFLCEHRVMRRRVALKVLSRDKTSNPSTLERFYREARAVAALDHPNIVRAYDIDQDGDMHFLIMEYIEGLDLQKLVKKQGSLDVGLAADYIRQAALGLQHAHERAGLVHRDIKPENMLVDVHGIVKILDLGLARFFKDEEDGLSKEFDEKVLGTTDYLAPEQISQGDRVDIRGDIYSLGATFYFCLTGRTPFGAGTPAQKRIWHQVRQPKPVRTLRPEVPEALAEIVAKMMAKDPAERYQLPAEVAQALEPWLPRDSEQPDVYG